MLVEQILEIIFTVLDSLLALLPSMPTTTDQFSALISAFVLLNKVIDVPFLVLHAIILLNLVTGTWVVKMTANLMWQIWKGVKW